MKLKAITSALLLSCFAGIAQAEISYSYAQAVHQIYSETDVYLWEIKGSYQIDDTFYVTMEDQNISTVLGAGQRSGSVGVFLPQQNGMHLYGELGLSDYVNDIYPVLEGGVRYEANSDFELRGALRLEPEMPVGAGDTGENLLIAEALYHLEKADLVGGLVVPTENDGSVLRLGARYNFD